MDGKYHTSSTDCDCRVTSQEPQKIYFRLAEGKWKKKCYYHKISFDHKRYSNGATLSSYV